MCIRDRCHYCGYSHKQDFVCPHCGGKHIKLTGLGTQKLEDEVSKLFPDARILRMDTDTTFSRFAYEEAFEKFGAGGYDIMLGTQMIAKGLDFPNVKMCIRDRVCSGAFVRCFESSREPS